MCVRAGEEGAVRALEDVHVFGLCAFLGGGGYINGCPCPCVVEGYLH